MAGWERFMNRSAPFQAPSEPLNIGQNQLRPDLWPQALMAALYEMTSRCTPNS